MTLRQVVHYYFSFFRQVPLWYVLWLLFIILATAVVRLIPYLFAQIIDTLQQKDFNYAQTLIFFTILAMLLTTLFSLAKQQIGDMILIKFLQREAHLRYIKALQNADYDYHTNRSSGSLISLAKRGQAATFTAFWEINGNSLQTILGFVVAIFILTTIDPSFALIVGLGIVASLISGGLLIRLNIKRRSAANKADDAITGLIVDNMIGFETVKIFAQERYELNRFYEKFIDWVRLGFRYVYTFRYIDLTLGAINIITYIAIFSYGLNGVQSGAISIGVFVAALVYVLDITNRLEDLIYKLRDMAKVYVDLVSYFQIMQIEPSIKDSPGAISLAKVEGKIEFKAVSFSYNVSGQALKNINLQINPDEKIALVGKSGSGKTTLTKLLLRFYEVSQGEIKLDGHNIKAIKLESLRKAIGLVPQDPVLFNETIGYNLTYARPEASMEEIRAAANQANLAEFIEALPHGYETMVGERGIKLSGGQRQRLAIARLIIENPEIVIFDEATSQLDSFNEAAIQEALWKLFKGRTTIIIAHRLSTIQKADRIIVFEQGEIVEQGKHQALIEQGGSYAKLWSLQTEGYIT